MSRIRINIEKVNEKFENFARFLISHRALLLVSFIALRRPDACRNGQVQGNVWQ